VNPRTQLAVAAAGVTLLSSTALHAVFEDTAWVAPVVGAVLAVLIGAEVGSRLGQHLVARAVWRFVGSALGALFYLTAVWAHEGAVLGFIPRGHTWHLFRVLFDRAFTEVHDSPTPAPTYKALMLLTALGVAAVAIAVDQLSVRAPLIGLPLLALYSVPEWLSKDGTGWIPLALGGGGYVGLLIREGRDRTSRWGRTVTGATALGRNRSAAGAMSQAGWRIGAVALGAALVVPPLIPDVGHFNLAKGGGVSSSAVLHYNLTANLYGSLHATTVLPLYSYLPSSGNGQYLQMAVSDTFTGKGFAEPVPVADTGIDPTSDQLPLDGVGSAASTGTSSTQIVIGPHLGQPQLPLPIGTTQVQGLQGQWAYQQSSATVFSQVADATKNQSFTAVSEVINPTPQTLQASSLSAADKVSKAADTVVPTDLPPIVAAKAKAVTKGATTEYEKAVALQDWFTNPKNFTYSLTGPANGRNYAALTAFLTTNRQGFCQQFSSAMAIMARTLGIPARVAFGFTSGVLRQGSASTYDVDNLDAHAWPELYFSGIGWLRFEPTPRSDHQTQPPDYGKLTVSEIQGLSKQVPGVTVSGGARATTAPSKRLPDEQLPGQHSGTTGKGGGGFSLPISGDALVWLLVAAGLVVVIGALPLAQSVARRRRLRHGDDPRAIALLAWRETLRDAYDLGHRTSAADSPRQTAHRLTDSAALSQTAAASMQRMARAVERARYAPVAGDPQGLLFDAAMVSAAMYGAAPRRAKLRARMLPPSTTQATAEAFSRVGAAVSRRLTRTGDRLTAFSNRVLHKGQASA
jgi:transglutaminase-like putative cysteine protease